MYTVGVGSGNKLGRGSEDSEDGDAHLEKDMYTARKTTAKVKSVRSDIKELRYLTVVRHDFVLRSVSAL